MKPGITWLASYPKSGNTWFRVFLTNYLRDGEEPASINELEKTLIASAREPFDEALGLEAADLTAAEIDRLRPEWYLHLVENAEQRLFMKVHDAYTDLPDGRPLFPTAATYGAVYLIRNPLDVAVSFAHHNGWDCETSVSRMAEESFSFCGKADRLQNQLRQQLLSWSAHVLSWVDRAPFPVCVLRYEDMKTRPQATFARAVRFARLEFDPARLEKALAFSSFEIVRQQEEAEGFEEKSAMADRFFRKGQVGSWREELTAGQVRRLIADHGPIMRRFSYLDDRGRPVY